MHLKLCVVVGIVLLCVSVTACRTPAISPCDPNWNLAELQEFLVLESGPFRDRVDYLQAKCCANAGGMDDSPFCQAPSS